MSQELIGQEVVKCGNVKQTHNLKVKYKEHYVDIIEDEVEKSHLWHLRCYTKKPENTATNF